MRYILELGPGHTFQAPHHGGRIIGMDLRQLGYTTVMADAGAEFPFRDQTFDHIFSSHLFEHLTFAQSEQCVKSSYRVLQPFGTLKFYLPDFGYWWLCYGQNGMTLAIRENIFGQQRHPWDNHLSGWDQANLRELLLSVGFAGVARLPGRSQDELCMTAVRPPEINA